MKTNDLAEPLILTPQKSLTESEARSLFFICTHVHNNPKRLLCKQCSPPLQYRRRILMVDWSPIMYCIKFAIKVIVRKIGYKQKQTTLLCSLNVNFGLAIDINIDAGLHVVIELFCKHIYNMCVCAYSRVQFPCRLILKLYLLGKRRYCRGGKNY